MKSNTLTDSQLVDCLKFVMEQARYIEARDLCEYILQRLQPDHEAYYAVRLTMLEIYLNLHDQENFIEAYTLYKEEIKRSEKQEDCMRLALFAGHYHTYMTGELDRALSYYQKTASLAFQHRFPRILSTAITGVAFIMHEQKVPYAQILELLKYNLASIQEVQDNDSLAYIDAHLMYCRTLVCLKDYNAAKGKVKELLALNVPPFIRLKLHLQLALCEYEEREYEKALQTCQEILAILKDNEELGESLSIYHEIYELMMRAAKALDCPVSEMYERHCREIRDKQEDQLQLKMASLPDFNASLPNYEPNESFFRKINRTSGTFFVLKTQDVQPVLSSIAKHHHFIWTTMINSYGFYLYAELSEEELAGLLGPFVAEGCYACCTFKPDTITPKECSHQMQALLYHREMLASEALYL